MGKQVAAGTFEGGIAQLGEHLLCKQGVKGSNPFISTQIAKSSQDQAGFSPEDLRQAAIGGVRQVRKPQGPQDGSGKPGRKSERRKSEGWKSWKAKPSTDPRSAP